VFCGLLLVLIGVSGAVYVHFVARFCIDCGAIKHGLWRASPWSTLISSIASERARLCWFAALME